MLVYLFLHLDSFVDVKLSARSPQHFIFMDLFNLHNIDYIRAHSYTNPASTIRGTFMWDRNEGELNRDTYNSYTSDFAGVFEFTDQHFFSEFGNPLNDIIKILGDFFRAKIDTSIKIQDFST